MTRQHYTAIAEAIASAPMSPATRATLIGRLHVVFLADNPRFNRSRFTAACQPPANAAPDGPKRATPCATVAALLLVSGGE